MNYDILKSEIHQLTERFIDALTEYEKCEQEVQAASRNASRIHGEIEARQKREHESISERLQKLIEEDAEFENRIEEYARKSTLAKFRGEELTEKPPIATMQVVTRAQEIQALQKIKDSCVMTPNERQQSNAAILALEETIRPLLQARNTRSDTFSELKKYLEQLMFLSDTPIRDTLMYRRHAQFLDRDADE